MMDIMSDDRKMSIQQLNTNKTSVSIKPHIKRPMSAYMLWSSIQRKKIAQEFPELSKTEVTKVLRTRWKLLSAHEKIMFTHEAKRLREEHKKDNPDYKYIYKQKPKQTIKAIDPPIMAYSQSHNQALSNLANGRILAQNSWIGTHEERTSCITSTMCPYGISFCLCMQHSYKTNSCFTENQCLTSMSGHNVQSQVKSAYQNYNFMHSDENICEQDTNKNYFRNYTNSSVIARDNHLHHYVENEEAKSDWFVQNTSFQVSATSKDVFQSASEIKCELSSSLTMAICGTADMEYYSAPPYSSQISSPAEYFPGDKMPMTSADMNSETLISDFFSDIEQAVNEDSRTHLLVQNGTSERSATLNTSVQNASEIKPEHSSPLNTVICGTVDIDYYSASPYSSQISSPLSEPFPNNKITMTSPDMNSVTLISGFYDTVQTENEKSRPLLLAQKMASQVSATSKDYFQSASETKSEPSSLLSMAVCRTEDMGHCRASHYCSQISSPVELCSGDKMSVTNPNIKSETSTNFYSDIVQTGNEESRTHLLIQNGTHEVSGSSKGPLQHISEIISGLSSSPKSMTFCGTADLGYCSASPYSSQISSPPSEPFSGDKMAMTRPAIDSETLIPDFNSDVVQTENEESGTHLVEQNMVFQVPATSKDSLQSVLNKSEALSSQLTMPIFGLDDIGYYSASPYSSQISFQASERFPEGKMSMFSPTMNSNTLSGFHSDILQTQYTEAFL